MCEFSFLCTTKHTLDGANQSALWQSATFARRRGKLVRPLLFPNHRLDHHIGARCGRAAWWPRISGGEIAIRARVSDVAGNQSVKQVKLPATEAPGIDNLAARPAIERPPVQDAGAASQTTARPSAAPTQPEPSAAAQAPQSSPVRQFAPGDPFARRGAVQNAFDPQSGQKSSSTPAPSNSAIAWPADRAASPLSAERCLRLCSRNTLCAIP